MKNNVYLLDCKLYEYNKEVFKVSDYYEELYKNNLEIASDRCVYNKVRDLLIEMKLDSENIGKKNWNPFGDFIKEGNIVLIKPNLVKHINESLTGNVDSLITNFSIIRPIIDYSILALGNTGKIVIGDSPVQECNFDEVIKINDLSESIRKYKSIFFDITLIDFRKNNNLLLKCKLVRIDENSSFCNIDSKNIEYAITNYNLKMMKLHHINGKHEYIIPEIVLKSDVILNLSKPKTHRKAGMTACMKNFVGINGNKECLPHHRTGSVKNNGDEFPENNIIKKIESYFKKFTYKKNKIINFIRLPLLLILKIEKKLQYQEGSWYGNDTIWRTILDLNKLILYADKSGTLRKKPQRVIFNLADMIISGEGDGPLLPTNKKVGYLVASFNQLNTDYVICKIMGFNPEKIKYISNGYKLKKFKISNNKVFQVIDNTGKLKKIEKYICRFVPSNGWKDQIEE
ncbi:MAG: DUF362 domain-containing protein [Bacilli bacterium]